MQQILKSVSIALHNIKANPFYTFLSTLGIIIGVASLVAILALGDGLEQTGRKQIESTTSVQMLSVTPKSIDMVNGVRVPRDTVYAFGVPEAQKINAVISDWGTTELTAQSTRMVTYNDSSVAVYIQATMGNYPHFLDADIIGSYFSTEEVQEESLVAVLSKQLALKWMDDPEQMIGNSIIIEGNSYRVGGIINDESQGMQVMIPVSTYKKYFKNWNQPTMILKSRNVEDVPVIKQEVETWLSEQYGGKEAFTISTYEGRVKQLSQGILVFKLVMGAITGISVLVGGIGIMNVLLISVKERTSEIGIRKATGARKKDIVLQFLSESVTISIVGSAIGWAVGVLGIFGLVALINRLTDLNFTSALSFGTVFLVLMVAILVGMIFGTYPAWKAANLTPVDAIRHE